MEIVETLIVLVGVTLVGLIAARKTTIRGDRTSVPEHIRHERVEKRIARQHGSCSVCNGTSFELGMLKGDRVVRFRSRGASVFDFERLMALRCDDCGNVMLFTEPAPDQRKARGTGKTVTVG